MRTVIAVVVACMASAGCQQLFDVSGAKPAAPDGPVGPVLDGPAIPDGATGPAPITLIEQESDYWLIGGSPTQAVLTQPVMAGDLIVVSVATRGISGVTLMPSGGEQAKTIITVTTPHDRGLTMYAITVSVGAPSYAVTFTYGTGDAAAASVVLSHYANAAVNSIDPVTNGEGTSATPQTATSFVTSVPGELVVAAVTEENVGFPTMGPGFTASLDATDDATSGCTLFVEQVVEANQGATIQGAAILSATDGWAMTMAEFAPAQ